MAAARGPPRSARGEPSRLTSEGAGLDSVSDKSVGRERCLFRPAPERDHGSHRAGDPAAIDSGTIVWKKEIPLLASAGSGILLMWISGEIVLLHTEAAGNPHAEGELIDVAHDAVHEFRSEIGTLAHGRREAARQIDAQLRRRVLGPHLRESG